MRCLPLAAGLLSLLCSLPGCSTAVVKGETGQDTGGSDTETPAGDDTDADTIPDSVEGANDTDSDGTPDAQDTDSDNDGVPDSVEAGDDDPSTAPSDSDGDGSPNYRDPDSDNNCVEDADESGGANPADTDADGVPDYADDDNDGDGIADADEIGSTCYPQDSDADGTPDYVDTDSDGDGLLDVTETDADTDGDGTPDYLDSDSDGDGASDASEVGTGEEPRDTDGDGTPDYVDSDSDNDGISDADETTSGTDAYDRDTDGDGESDGGEVAAGTDPTDSTSMSGDGYLELVKGENGDVSLDFTLSNAPLDIVFLVEDTYYNRTNYNALGGAMGDLLDELAASGDGFGYSFATFEDYAYASYGTSGYDKPFRLQQQITDDTSAIVSAAGEDLGGYGGDQTDSAMEALYQTLTGEGYDQDCHEDYDSSTDVLPFIASPSDPFGGTEGESHDASDDFAGTSGGVGFRDGTTPVIIYFASTYLRDPEADSGFYNGSPGGCPADATGSDVIETAVAMGAYLIGVGANGSHGTDQMETLATETGSYGDTDGDGREDDLMVTTWSGTDEDELFDFVLAGVDAVYGTLSYDTVELTASDDPYGFVTAIAPSTVDVSPGDAGETVTFLVGLKGTVESTSEDQIFTVTFSLLADSATEIDTRTLVIVVPAE